MSFRAKRRISVTYTWVLPRFFTTLRFVLNDKRKEHEKHTLALSNLFVPVGCFGANHKENSGIGKPTQRAATADCSIGNLVALYQKGCEEPIGQFGFNQRTDRRTQEIYPFH